MFGYVIRTITVLSAALAVQAFQAPVIIGLDASLEAKLGSSATIDCLAQGDPRPTVTLYRNGEYVQGQEAATFSPTLPHFGAAKYRFTAVQGSGGPYECRATNGIADSNGNVNIKKFINVIIIGISSTTTSAPQTVALSTAPSTPEQPTTEINTGISPTTSSASQTVALSTAPPTSEQPTTEINTDPTTSATTKIIVKPVDNKNSFSGSSSSSALSLLAVLPIVISAFLCQG